MSFFSDIADSLYGDTTDPYKAKVRDVDPTAFEDPYEEEKKISITGYQGDVAVEVMLLDFLVLVVKPIN